jgi:hypothetical protein
MIYSLLRSMHCSAQQTFLALAHKLLEIRCPFFRDLRQTLVALPHTDEATN